MADRRSTAWMAAAPAGPDCVASSSASLMRQNRSNRLPPLKGSLLGFSALARRLTRPPLVATRSGTARSPPSACSHSLPLTMMPTTRSMSSPTPLGNDMVRVSPLKGERVAMPSPKGLEPPGRSEPSGGGPQPSPPSTTTPQCSSRFPPMPVALKVMVRVPSGLSTRTIVHVPPGAFTVVSYSTLPGGAATAAEVTWRVAPLRREEEEAPRLEPEPARRGAPLTPTLLRAEADIILSYDRTFFLFVDQRCRRDWREVGRDGGRGRGIRRVCVTC
mmetsp:Transcript_41380/g.101965  ORF Transcript_41380/g.101965 Transcript_41380/m.101965 type:complete len:274 (+) Transcript_41380:2845-3666(+)